MVDIEDVLNKIETMKNQEILNQHHYAISQGSNGRWYTYLPDANRPNGRRQIAKSSKEKIEKEVIHTISKRIKKKVKGIYSSVIYMYAGCTGEKKTVQMPKPYKRTKMNGNVF